MDRRRILEEAEQKKRSLDRRYAYENNSYEIGDLCQTHLSLNPPMGFIVRGATV